ncbi:MAG: PepSY domain-containing protein [Armatimonadetes bacterium]|nr:PepSY domain-containing protein [Armatimonadota bacterium]
MKTNQIRKVHRIIGYWAFFFCLWSAVTAIFLTHRDDIRNIGKKAAISEPNFCLNYTIAAMTPDDAVKRAWQDVKDAGFRPTGINRLEFKYEQGTMIYRVRFKTDGPWEPEATFDALTGKMLVSAQHREIKALMKDFHHLEFVPGLPALIGQYVNDVAWISILLFVLSGIWLFFRTRKCHYKDRVRKWHRIAATVIAFPFLVVIVCGLLLNHKDLLPRNYKTPKVTTERSEFEYSKLPITVEKVCGIFQSQFPRFKNEPIRRIFLKYKDGRPAAYEVGTTRWRRGYAVIDPYTGKIIKPLNKGGFEEIVRALHQGIFLFGSFSKFLADLIALVVIFSAFTGGWLLLPRKRRMNRSMGGADQEAKTDG